MTKRPTVHLKSGEERRIIAGHPWVYSNELQIGQDLKALKPGTIVTLRQADGNPLGLAFFNPKSLISCRVITRDHSVEIDAAFWHHRLQQALKLRERLVGIPYYRLAHAEADGFPGCVIDRYGDVIVLNISSAGMDNELDSLVASVNMTLDCRVILARGEGLARELEGLEPLNQVIKGNLDSPVDVIENNTRFECDPRAGQKTGWFFDQRDNRALISRLAKNAKILDVYCYMSGFGNQALKAGATSVLALDRSAPALEFAKRAAELNGTSSNLKTHLGDAFDLLPEIAREQERFDVVVADPPAFIKSKKDFHQGSRAYRKLARLASSCVSKDGILMICSCSHNMPADEFVKQVARGITETGRRARMLYHTGAAPDHPVHPGLPESAYLKALTFAIE